MAENQKMNFISDITELLLSKYNLDDVNTIVNMVSIKLNEYELSEKSTELAVIDTKSQMMLKKFLATKMVEGRSPKTINRYRYIINKMITCLNIDIEDIDVFALRMYLAQLEVDGLKAVTVEGVRNIISSFFTWLHGEGFIEKNPTINLGRIKCKKEVKIPFSKTEIEMLKSQCDNIRDRVLIEFLLSTGCRASELISVNIDDINFQKQECKILGKGNKERVVFINDVCKLHLQDYIKTRKDDNPALFLGSRNTRITTDGVRFILKQLSEKANVTNVHPHRFRRTLATSLIDKGMQVQDVAVILGHNNINTTMTYVYSDIKNVKNAYSKYAV